MYLDRTIFICPPNIQEANTIIIEEYDILFHFWSVPEPRFLHYGGNTI